MKAIVFDLDGVIVQSMEAHAAAYAKVLAPLGVEVSPREVFLREGARSETILRDLLGAAGQKPTDGQVAALAEQKQAAFLAGTLPRAYPGAGAMLAAAWNTGRPTAVVTGTRRVNLDKLIPDWVGRFDALLTQESYVHDKPHPEPYAKAAEALGVDTADCLCIENAIRGIQSAKAAGYGEVWAITTTLTRDDLADAEPDLVVADHHEMAERLQHA